MFLTVDVVGTGPEERVDKKIDDKKMKVMNRSTQP